MPTAVDIQEELLLGFPRKHIGTILPPYVTSLASCRMDPQFILVH